MTGTKLIVIEKLLSSISHNSKIRKNTKNENASILQRVSWPCIIIVRSTRSSKFSIELSELIYRAVEGIVSTILML